MSKPNHVLMVNEDGGKWHCPKPYVPFASEKGWREVEGEEPADEDETPVVGFANFDGDVLNSNTGD